MTIEVTDHLVWYAAYGSNLSRERFLCYVHGGRPSGAARSYPGCRDRRTPVESRAIRVPGRLHFAGESTVWDGGMGYFDPAGDGEVLMRAYLLRRGQLLDVLDQEMHRVPGTLAGADLRLTETDAVTVRLGDGRYETLHRVGSVDGLPVLTLSHGPSGPGADPRSPSPAYLAQLIRGLAESHQFSAEQIATYLGQWTGINDAPYSLRDVVAAATGDGEPGSL